VSVRFPRARDLAIVGLMLLPGLRSKEVVALNLEDIQLAESRMRAGREVRYVCGRWPSRPFTNWTTTRGWNGPPPAAPLCSFRRRARPRRSYHVRAIAFAVSLSPAAPVASPEAHPRRFRHNFASDMVHVGISLPALMNLMGHAAISTTMIYVQISPAA